jgi:dethiobiotin synthetase
VRGVFVTGTGTGVGKTIVSAALIAAMRTAGEPVRAHKPVVTGLEEQQGRWPPDHELLGAVAGMDPREVAPVRYGPAVSPHLAAALAGDTNAASGIVERALAAGAMSPSAGVVGCTEDDPPILVVEGVGGLLVPLADDFTVCELAAALGLPLIVVATPGLGTINHTLLTLRTARSASLDVRAVVLTPWPDGPSEMEISNRHTIERLGRIEVFTMGPVSGPEPGELARCGSTLPWRQWLV